MNAKNGQVRGVLLLALTTAVLASCTTLFGGRDLQVRPVETVPVAGGAQHDRLYDSAVTAINARDYARALDYLHEARSRDPRNVPVLNALGVVYDKLGRFDLSQRYYAEASAVEPNSRIVSANIAYSRLLQGLMNSGSPTIVASGETRKSSDAVAAQNSPSGTSMAVAAATIAMPRSAVPVPIAEKILITGHPLEIVNASGQIDGTGAIKHRLIALGWTARQSENATPQLVTILHFPGGNLFAAQALQRTLPFPVRMTPDNGGNGGMRLIIGLDYLSWKPKSLRVTTLWKKQVVVAALAKSPAKETP